MWKGDNLAGKGIPDEVAVNLYVLRALVVDRICGNLDGTSVVSR